MSVNIYDIAYSLQNAFKEQPEFKNLQSLYSQVLADPNAKPLFMEFQNFQKVMQQKMYSGEAVTPEENAKGQEIVARVSQNPLIANLMQVEQRLNLVIQDVNKIVMSPLEEFYKSLLEL
ncbi:YlbF family regulator [Gottfriedia sp. NPDC057991]|uniref:YlbF family regulator n=1 Tax=Gottfriedia sp. NPDC057991 TaxID=3346298 RepID=UPI0036DD1872